MSTPPSSFIEEVNTQYEGLHRAFEEQARQYESPPIREPDSIAALALALSLCAFALSLSLCVKLMITSPPAVLGHKDGTQRRLVYSRRVDEGVYPPPPASPPAAPPSASPPATPPPPSPPPPSPVPVAAPAPPCHGHRRARPRPPPPPQTATAAPDRRPRTHAGQGRDGGLPRLQGEAGADAGVPRPLRPLRGGEGHPRHL